MNLKDTVHSKYVDLIEMDSDELVVCIIKKHPIGLLPIFITGLSIAILVMAASYGFGYWLDAQGDVEISFPLGLITAIVGIVVSLLVVFFTFVAGFVYQNNIIIVTSDKIAQILYRNLVDRKISQLSLGDLQDVTVDQRGLFARVFRYGTLVIETAGEQNNYNFTYTPLPYECAKELVGAREASIKAYGN